MDSEVFLKIFALITFTALSSCTSEFQRPTPETLTPFIEHSERLQHQDRLPFALSYVDYKAISRLQTDSNTIYLEPIDIQFLNYRAADINLSDSDLKEILYSLNNSFMQALDRKKLSTTTSLVGSQYVLQIALLELVPTDSWLEGSTDLAGLFIPGAKLVVASVNAAEQVASHEAGTGSVALAIKLKDKNEKMVTELYDSRQDRVAILLSTHDFSKLGNAKEIMADWAKEFAELLTGSPASTIDSPSSFALILW